MANITAIATSQQSVAMRQIIAQKSSDLGTLSEEAATGMKEDVFKSSPALMAGTLEMRSKIAENNSYMMSNKLLRGKLDITADILSSFQKEAGDFQTLSLGGVISEGTCQPGWGAEMRPFRPLPAGAH